MWRAVLLCFVCFALSSEDDGRCLDDPSTCRDSAQPAETATRSASQTAVEPPMTVKTIPAKDQKHSVQAPDVPPELLSIAKTYIGDQVAPLTATALMSVRMPRNVAEAAAEARPHKRFFLQLLLRAYRGRLLVHDAVEGKLLLENETSLEITMMKTSGDRLAVAYKDHSIRVFKLVPFGEQDPPVSAPHKLSKDNKKPPTLLRLKLEAETVVLPYVRSHSLEYSDLPSNAILNQVPAALTALSIQVLKGKIQWLVAGYADGMVVSFTKDGTIKSEVPTNSSIVGFAPGQGSVVVTINGEGYGLLKLSNKASSLTMFCNHTANGTVIGGVAFDPVTPTVAYAVSQSGSLVVFNAKPTKNMTTYCRPKHVVIVEEGSSLHLAVTKGFIFITSPSVLYVYNITNTRTREPPSLTVRRPLLGDFSPLPSFAAPSILSHDPLSLHILLRESNEEYIEVSQLATGESIVFQSHLPFTEESKSSMMFRLPILLGGIVAMGFYQMYKKRKATPNLNDPFMRELREIGKRTTRLDPRREARSNRRAGLAVVKKKPVLTRENPENRPFITEDADADLSDPEELLRHRSAYSLEDD